MVDHAAAEAFTLLMKQYSDLLVSALPVVGTLFLFYMMAFCILSVTVISIRAMFGLDQEANKKDRKKRLEDLD
jgi:hypothetical protein